MKSAGLGAIRATVHFKPSTMFEKDALDALFGELETSHSQSPDYDQLLRDAHLGIALSDAGKQLDPALDSRVLALIEKHKPG